MSNDFTLLLPEFLLTGLAFLILSVDFVLPSRNKHLLAYLAVIGLAGTLVFSLVFLWNKDTTLYDGIIRIDAYSLFFKAVFLVIGGFVILSSVGFVKKHLAHQGEYYGILIFSILAMVLMAASGELLTAYIALELLSFSLYILVSYNRFNPKSNEAGIKYILLGAFSSALLLYGISLIYGMLGTTRFDGIHDQLSAMVASGSLNPSVLAGLTLIIAGLGFKVAAVPFHMWAPDVYEGAPTPITAYLAAGSKAAAFALILRLFGEAFMPAIGGWQIILAILAAFTMTIGNLVALAQRNIKRMLAYSSIGQVGYLLLGVAALGHISSSGAIESSQLASSGLVLHLVGYGVATLAAFLCVIAVFNVTNKEEIRDFAGLAQRAPFVALVLTVSLFSLAGLPIFAGFTTKFYLFTAAASEGLLWLSGLAILNSLISLYYYLMVIRQMYVEKGEETRPIPVPLLISGTLAVLFGGIILIGVYPGPLVKAIEGAVAVVGR